VALVGTATLIASAVVAIPHHLKDVERVYSGVAEAKTAAISTGDVYSS
jgi:hypothetical protein